MELNLDALLALNHMSLSDLSKATNIPYRTLQDWKLRKRSPRSISQLKALADGLGLESVEQLYEAKAPAASEEFKNGKLIVDCIIHDPRYPSNLIVKIGSDYFLTPHILSINKTLHLQDLRPYRSNISSTAWEAPNYEYVMYHMERRGGYDLAIGRPATQDELNAVISKYNLSEDDISEPFDDTYGALFGAEHAVTIKSVQLRIHEAISVESYLTSKGIQAVSVSGNRVNVRIQ